MITKARLEQLFYCYPHAGKFINRISRGAAGAGSRAGYIEVHGYRRICIDGVKYYEHQLIWLYHYGSWPREVDHIDGDRAHNAIHNLRVANRSENNFNSERATGTSGLRGAYLDYRVQRWYSKIQLGGQVKWLGHYDTAEEAHLAFMAAVDKHHGRFALHNRPTIVRRRV